LSNDVLFEYLEVIQQKTTPFIAENIVMSLLSTENITLHEISFKWTLVEHDTEDNKFCDLAIAGNADYLETNDSHFNIVKLNRFPPVNIVSADEFVKILK
jgi:uncharacterized protein